MQTKKAVTHKGEAQSVLFAMLKKDHKLFKELFKQIQDERSDDIFEELNEKLEVHMVAEEEYFYPLLKEESSMESKALEALEEHNLGRSIVALINEEVDDKVWLARIKVLKEVVEHHIEEEEKEIFPEASKKLDREDLEDIAERIKAQKDDDNE